MCVTQKPKKKHDPPKKNRQNSENKRSIGISDVRDILHVSHMKPYEGSYRVTIIDDADLMTLEASNALLKTLEEPAEQNVFVLLTANEEALIPTIKSRCQSIYFSILDSESVSQHLSQNLSQTAQCLLSQCHSNSSVLSVTKCH